MELIVPPQIVSRRGEAEYFSAPLTDRPLAWKPSDGNAWLSEDGIDGHIDEIAPPELAQILPPAFVTFHVARKSYALWPPAVKSYWIRIVWLPAFRPSTANRNGTIPPSG